MDLPRNTLVTLEVSLAVKYCINGMYTQDRY